MFEVKDKVVVNDEDGHVTAAAAAATTATATSSVAVNSDEIHSDAEALTSDAHVEAQPS